MLILNNFKVLKQIVGYELLNTASYIHKQFSDRINTLIVQLYIHMVLHLLIQQVFKECRVWTGHHDSLWGYRADKLDMIDVPAFIVHFLAENV